MNVRRATLVMSTANAAALLAALGGYFAYSRLLSPGDFALYASALAIAKLGTMLLDGGIKVALIKEGGNLAGGAYRSAFLACALLALGSTVVLTLVLAGIAAGTRVGLDTVLFLGLYAAAYFATYPILVIPLADLERNLSFGAVARAEGLTICVEYGLPAVLWVAVRPGLWSFVASVWLARALRAALLLGSTRNREWLRTTYAPDWTRLKILFGFGFQFQLASLASVVRDSQHLILIVPLFGRELAGMYAWVIQLCAVTSQVFVQTASRVSLPALIAASDDSARWRATLSQVQWLTVVTFPPLACLQYLAPAVNHAFFRDKWTGALALLPFMICRMLPGLVTTPLGSLLLAQKGARGYATSNIAWTAAELCVATVLLFIAGSRGLAWSYSFMAWFGVVVFAMHFGGRSVLTQLLRSVLLRPSVWLALGLTFPYGFLPKTFRTDLGAALLYSLCVCVISVMAEPCVRQLFPRRQPCG